MRQILFILIWMLMLAVMPVSYAATIHGTVYDLSLKKVTNAKVEINTVPKQTVIAQNGSYSFNVPIGKYLLDAYMVQKSEIIASVQENITIRQDGSYVLDLILFPDVEEGVEGISIEVEEVSGSRNLTSYMVFSFAALTIIAVFFYIRQNRKKIAKAHIKGALHVKAKNVSEEKHEAPPEDLNAIIKIIEKEGGRATQKEIRKRIPLSEAKVSLMIAELEHKGIVEKIKKGRGNIIILKK